MSEAFVIIDLETTHREPDEAHIVEWAAVRIEPEWFGTGRRMECHGALVKPPIAIPPETSAVHQITDSDVSEAAPWQEESAHLAELLAPAGVIAVAHNADFERRVLAKEGLPSRPTLATLVRKPRSTLLPTPNCGTRSTPSADSAGTRTRGCGSSPSRGPMGSPEMHLAVDGKAERPCDTCGTVFRPKRAWARFCGTPCRNAFHAAEARLEKIREAAPALYEALHQAREVIRGNDLEQVWLNYPTEPSESLGQRIDRVLGSLKPPVEPKALLDKAKA